MEGRSRAPSTRGAVATGLCWVWLVAIAACASSPEGGGGGGGDAAPADAGGDGAPVDAAIGTPSGARGAFCGGGGRSRAGAGPSDPVHLGCAAPADLAAHERRQGTIRWQPGPIYVVTP